jgi:hypothetical protein
MDSTKRTIYPLMARRRACAVSNHEATLHLILRDAAKTPLLRMSEIQI